MLERLLESVLMDADRVDTADFMHNCQTEQHFDTEPLWEQMAQNLEKKLAQFADRTDPVSKQRQDISERCSRFADHAAEPVGACRLIVPTGGGKTLSSLRFAIHECRKFKMEKIVYVAPFMSILEQNSKDIREIAGAENFFGTPLQCARTEKVGGGTSGVRTAHGEVGCSGAGNHHGAVFAGAIRRKKHLGAPDAPPLPVGDHFGRGAVHSHEMHAFAESGGEFPDENLRLYRGALLCNTASSGKLGISDAAGREQQHDRGISKGFRGAPANRADSGFRNILLRCSSGILLGEVLGAPEPAGRGQHQGIGAGAVSAIAGGTGAVGADHAADPFDTHMCPAHRNKVIEQMRKALKQHRPILCVTTQLIEAGVDVSFGCVVRSMAGLSNAAQAAGRCNRNGELKQLAPVYLLELSEEKLGSLAEISLAQSVTRTILDSGNFADLLSVEAMFAYFRKLHHDFEKDHKLSYPVGKHGEVTLLELLSTDRSRVRKPYPCSKYALQAFATAGAAFQVIDDTAETVIVPYDDSAEEMILRLNGDISFAEMQQLLRQVQQYTISVYAGERKSWRSPADCIRCAAVHWRWKNGSMIQRRLVCRSRAVRTSFSDSEICRILSKKIIRENSYILSFLLDFFVEL